MIKFIKKFINFFLFILGAHHVDFRAATKDDPKWLIEQRENEIKIIKQWIDQYHKDLKD